MLSTACTHTRTHTRTFLVVKLALIQLSSDTLPALPAFCSSRKVSGKNMRFTTQHCNLPDTIAPLLLRPHSEQGDQNKDQSSALT